MSDAMLNAILKIRVLIYLTALFALILGNL